MSQTCVVLLSGGMDSATLALHCQQKGYDVTGLAVDYGQRHRRELVAAQKVADALTIPLQLVTFPSFASVAFTGSQTGALAVPQGHYTDESMKATVVPNRNMMLLSIAASYGISLATQLGRHGAFIAYAAHAGDHTIYPDCRPIFVIAMRTALNAASEDPAIELIAPFIRMTKAELLAYGLGLRPDIYKHTYSCYNGGEEACGLCGTCVERLEAFALNDTKDPITYAQQGTEAL